MLEKEEEYKEGLRFGICKQYHINGVLKYEGEYLNDLKNGKGKEYDSFGRLISEGEYRDGIILNGNKKNIIMKDNAYWK